MEVLDEVQHGLTPRRRDEAKAAAERKPHAYHDVVHASFTAPFGDPRIN